MNIFNSTECADVNGECRYVQELNAIHFFTIAGVFLFVYLLFVTYLYCSLGSKLAHYKKLPRKGVDVGRYHLSKQMQKNVQESQQRMKQMAPKPLEPSDKSYGIVFNETTNENVVINYQKTVALSYQTIDDDINKLYPNLKRTDKQDLRTYVKFLQSKFPKLTDTICENYIRTYEVAKFSDHEWNSEMFEEWYGFFKEFTSSLTLPSDIYALGDNGVGVLSIRHGIQQSRSPVEALDDSESEDLLLLNYDHGLEGEYD